MNKKIKGFIVLFFLSLCCISQTSVKDSLLQRLRIEKNDTNKVNTLNVLSVLSSDNAEYEEEMRFGKEGLALSEKLKWKKGIALSLLNIGNAYDSQGDFEKSLESYTAALKIYEELGDDLQVAVCLGNIGTIHEIEGNYPQALDYYFKSLKISEAFGNKKRLAITLSNIGNVYNAQGDFTKALAHLFKALKLAEELGEPRGIAANLVNIGNVYNNKKDYPPAIDYYLKALKITEEIKEVNYTSILLGNIGTVYHLNNEYDKGLEYCLRALELNTKLGRKSGIAFNLSNIGAIYRAQGIFDKALDYSFKALEMNEKMGTKSGIVIDLQQIGSIYSKQKKYALATDYLNKSLELSRQINSKVDISVAYAKKAIVDSAMGDYKNAFLNYKMHIMYNDSVNSEEAKRKNIEIAMQYEFDKKQTADSLLLSEERKINTIKFEEEKSQRRYLYVGLAIIILFAGFIYSRFRVSQNQKRIIEYKEKETQLQKHIIEEKHKEIKDSINYAERIQRSLLASDELLNENLPGAYSGEQQTITLQKNHFVYFKPKDIVSGDFYWASKLSNANFALVTADSTGHGVPGAIMSILNIACLNEAIKEGHNDPDVILNETRKKIIEILKRDGSEHGGKDGMDCSVLVFEPVNPSHSTDHNFVTRVHIAAAYNPVWIARSQNVAEGTTKQLLEIKADKMPVGKHDQDAVSFSKHTIELYKGDTIYTLTDGFPDQFGGGKGKKYMIKKLKELLFGMSHLPMDEQYQKLATEFSDWKGNTEQVDDVTVIGIRI